MRWTRPAAAALALGLTACAVEPLPLPAAEAVTAAEAAAPAAGPPLYQLLYEAPGAPAPSAQEQRVRLLIWLRHLSFTVDQLDRLAALRVQVAERRARLLAAEARRAAEARAQAAPAWDALWATLADGRPLDAPEHAAAVAALAAHRAGGAHEKALVTLRLDGVRGMLDAQSEFLRSLSPQQEAQFADALFLLRHRLDPLAQPGDFEAIVGTLYDPGQYGVLIRGADAPARAPLDIGALWSDSPGLDGHALHSARREVLLFLLLLEPGLDEAVVAARALALRAPPPGQEGVPGAPAAPPPGAPPPPAPGTPAAPAPGTPEDPAPGAPAPPPPGVPGAPPPAPPGG